MRFAIVILAAFALLLAGCTSAQQQAPVPSNTATPPATGNAQITLAQLAAHNTEADCWVGYDGQAYDITEFIPNHKNYQALIVPLCGSSDQFKAKFEGKHGMSKVSLLENQTLVGNLAAQ